MMAEAPPSKRDGEVGQVRVLVSRFSGSAC